jgi:hypothetical protein
MICAIEKNIWGKYVKRLTKIDLHDDNTDFGFRTFQESILYNSQNPADLQIYLKKQRCLVFAQSKMTSMGSR